MTNKDVINWVKLGGSEGAIIELINETKVKQFDVSRDEKASAHPTQELRDYYKRARNSFEEKWYRGSKNRVVN